MELFQYVIFWTPTTDQAKEGKKPEIIVEFKTVLAKSKESANMLAAKEIPDKYNDEIDQVTIALRPF